MQHDTPERQALLKSAGMDGSQISPRMLASLARRMLDMVDDDDPHWHRKWEEMPHPSRDTEPKEVGLNTRRLSTLIERPVEWLWWQRVPLGKLTIVSGDPDLGKTWLLLDIIARVTTGRDFADGAKNPFLERRDALWVSAEDEDEDTILPRLRMLKGDVSRVHSLAFVFNKGERIFNIREHLDDLDRWLGDHPLVAVVAFDPLAAFLGGVDSHKNADVRELMTPLKTLAEKHGVAILGNNHLTKSGGGSALYRGMGSIAFVAAARSSWLVTRDPQQPNDRRLFTKVKNNVASEDVGGLAFRVGPAHKDRGGFYWEAGRVDVTADEALAKPEKDRAPALAQAKEWLSRVLQVGPQPAKEILEGAKLEGIAERTLYAAKTELGVVSEKTGGRHGAWMWRLPGG